MEARPPTPDPTAVSKGQADAIYQVILDLKEAGHLAKRQLNLELVASTLMTRFEIDSLEYAHNLLSSTGSAILESMNEARTNTFDWSKKVIYRELKAASRKNKTENVTFTPLRPRIADDDDSSDEESDNEHPLRRRRPRHRKSVLRPKSQIATKKRGKRTRSALANEYDTSDDNREAMDEVETPSKVRGGHDLVRDPLSNTARRRTRSILSDSEATPAIERTPLQETLQSRNTSVSAAERAADMDSSLDINHATDTWNCQVPGCDKAIAKATSKRGQEMIQDHSLVHADDTKAKVDLVVAEQRLNLGLSVDNLLGRIRGMGTLNGAMSALNEETNAAPGELGT